MTELTESNFNNLVASNKLDNSDWNAIEKTILSEDEKKVLELLKNEAHKITHNVEKKNISIPFESCGEELYTQIRTDKNLNKLLNLYRNKNL